jgi:hypothetical protein
MSVSEACRAIAAGRCLPTDAYYAGWAVLFGSAGPNHYFGRDPETTLISAACGATRNLHGRLFESDAFARCRACEAALREPAPSRHKEDPE